MVWQHPHEFNPQQLVRIPANDNRAPFHVDHTRLGMAMVLGWANTIFIFASYSRTVAAVLDAISSN